MYVVGVLVGVVVVVLFLRRRRAVKVSAVVDVTSSDRLPSRLRDPETGEVL